jgi:hypothetical protein
LVDLEDLAHNTVLSAGSIGAGVLEWQAVLIDTLACRLGIGDELLCADDENDVDCAPGGRSR